jgi:hypothetical protein
VASVGESEGGVVGGSTVGVLVGASVTPVGLDDGEKESPSRVGPTDGADVVFVGIEVGFLEGYLDGRPVGVCV